MGVQEGPGDRGGEAPAVCGAAACAWAGGGNGRRRGGVGVGATGACAEKLYVVGEQGGLL